jgi:hypothetical protein
MTNSKIHLVVLCPFVSKENLIKILFYNVKVKLPQINFKGFA